MTIKSINWQSNSFNLPKIRRHFGTFLETQNFRELPPGGIIFRNNHIYFLLEEALLRCCKIDRMNLFHWISPFLCVNEGFGWKVRPHFTSELFPLRPRELSKLRLYIQCECNKMSVPSKDTAHLCAGRLCLFCHMKIVLSCHLIPHGCAECIFLAGVPKWWNMPMSIDTKWAYSKWSVWKKVLFPHMDHGFMIFSSRLNRDNSRVCVACFLLLKG